MSMNRRFGIFVLGSLLASFGGWINFLAILDLAIWRFRATPFELVVLSAALLLPSVLLTKTVSRVCTLYVGSAVIVLSLAMTVVTTGALMEVSDFPVFLTVVALKSAVLSFVDPWQMRYVTVLLEETQQTGAFRALAFTQNVAKIGAPAAGAVLTAWAGNGQTMRLSIALITAAIGLMLLSAPWRVQSKPVVPTEKPRVSRARLRGPLAPLLYCTATCFAMSSAINNQFPLMLKINGFGESMLGVLVSCSAIGGILGSALPLRSHSETTGIGSIAGTAIASAITFIAIGSIFRLPIHAAQYLLAVAFFGTGLIGARFRIICRIYLTRRFPDTVASASATLQSCAMLAQFVAPCGGALLISYFSTSNVFLVLGTATTVILLAGAAVFQRDQQNLAAVIAASDVAAGSDLGSKVECDALR